MFKVTLHIYDLSGGLAAQFSRQMIGKQIDGIWHTGIVVYDKEFYFGGGISYDLPACTPFGQPTKKMELGETEIPEEMFMELLRDIAPRYTEQTYNVLKHNCNNFTDEVAQVLLGEGIPSDIVNLPEEFLSTPLGQQIAPMMGQMQDNLKLNSNQLFTDAGEQAPLQVRQPGQHPGQQQRQNPAGMGGMPGAGGPGGQPDMAEMARMMQGMGGMPGMANNPQMQQMMRQFANGGGAGAQPTSFAQPTLGEVMQITSLAHLQLLIKEQPAVVVDFWSPSCPPCMRFKPVYENTARANQNPKIVFCAVNVQQSRDIGMAFQVQSIPQFNFFIDGKEHTKFVGADENKFRQALGELHKVTSSKAGEHMHIDFKQFKPMNRLPVCFTNKGALEKMKSFISSFAKISENDVRSTANLMAWLDGSMDLEAVPQGAIDELVELAEIAEDKNKIALIDLFRLLILKDKQAEYILTKHWELIAVCIIGYLSAQDLKDKDAKVMQNYHLACLKFLANIFQTSEGKQIMQNVEYGRELIEFCSRSLLSCNQKVVYHAALVLFNYVLCFESDNKKALQPALENCFKTIDEALGDINVVDQDTLKALLLAECRILYKNSTMCSWVEDSFKLFFSETHGEVKKRTQHASVKEAIEDVLSMVNIEEKKK